MRRAAIVFTMTLALAAAGACRAATLVSTDFSKGDTQGWVLNGDQVKIVEVAGDAAHVKALLLTSDDGGQPGVAWTTAKFKVPSFSYIADVQIRHDFSLGCPADGFAISFANVDDTSTVGGGGGALGLFGGPDRFTAFEINTWRDQGAGTEADRADCTSGKNETFSIDLINPDVEDNARVPGDNGAPDKGGPKIGQIVPPAGMKIVNGGFYRYQWNVAPDSTMTVYVTGLSDGNKQFQKVKVLEVKIDPALKAIDFEGRFGLHAATGGAFQITEVAAVRIESPIVEPQ
jgi:hypothetical protein